MAFVFPESQRLAETVTARITPLRVVISETLHLVDRTPQTQPRPRIRHRFDLGLGGIFRDHIIDAQFTEGAWPLSELIQDAKDITGNGLTGTYTGTGFTRGVSVELPEGGLGCSNDGNGYVLIPNDNGNPGMSLAAGDMDLAMLFRTSTNDATVRAMISKHDSGSSSGNGWHVAMVSGGIQFYLKVGGVVVFNFNRGSGLADNEWHLVTCHLVTTTGRATIYIDGALSGAAVTGATTEPAQTTGDINIFRFGDGSGHFIGGLSYVMIGREGDETISTRLQASREWTTITDVRASASVRIHRGFGNPKFEQRIAETGTCQLVLDNTASRGTIGRYTPGHANAISGFDVGTPVAVTLIDEADIDHVVFRGSVESIRPSAGVHRDRDVTVQVTDWINQMANRPLGYLPIKTDLRSDQALKWVIDQAERPPIAVDIGAGVVTYPVVFDIANSDDSILTEMARVALNEPGYLYISAEGTLTYEGMNVRQTDAIADATFTETASGLEVLRDRADVINIVNITQLPREFDASTQVLWKTQERQRVLPGQSIDLQAKYRDDDQRAASVGATDTITPVPVTDYTMTVAQDGSGNDLTASMDVVAEFGGDGFELTCTNSHATLTGWLYIQVRGKAVRRYEPVTKPFRDQASVRQHGPRPLNLDLGYKNSTLQADGLADIVFSMAASPEVYKPARAMTIFSRVGTAGFDYVPQVLNRDVGDRIVITEAMTAQSAEAYYIHAVDLELRENQQVRALYTLVPPMPLSNDLIVTYDGAANGTQNVTFDGPLLLTTAGAYTFTFNRDGNVRVKGIAGGGKGGNGAGLTNDYQAGGGGGGGGATNMTGVIVAVSALTSYVGTVGAGGSVGASTGGISNFGVTALTPVLELGGGVGGGAAASHTAGTGGAGGAVIQGINGIAGGAGAAGGSSTSSVQNVGGTASNGTGARGGGGGGGGASFDASDTGQNGGDGGDSPEQNGGTGGAGLGNGPGSAGANASGFGAAGCLSGQSAPGGGGGGGGGLQVGTALYGGGGGGGGGCDATGGGGIGGNGSVGALLIEEEA